MVQLRSCRCCCGFPGQEVDASDSSVVAVDEKKLPDHLQPNSTLVFSVSVIEAEDISPQYSDIFCQFKYDLLLHLMLCKTLPGPESTMMLKIGT